MHWQVSKQCSNINVLLKIYDFLISLYICISIYVPKYSENYTVVISFRYWSNNCATVYELRSLQSQIYMLKVKWTFGKLLYVMIVNRRYFVLYIGIDFYWKKKSVENIPVLNNDLSWQKLIKFFLIHQICQRDENRDKQMARLYIKSNCQRYQIE